MRSLRVILLLTGLLTAFPAISQVKVDVKHNGVPVVVDRKWNVVTELTIDCPDEGQRLEEVAFSLSGLPSEAVRPGLRFSGRMSGLLSRNGAAAPWEQRGRRGGGHNLLWDDDFSIDWTGSVSCSGDSFRLVVPQGRLAKGKNFVWISLSVDCSLVPDLSEAFTLTVDDITVDGKQLPVGSGGIHRLGIALRNWMDDGSYSYRIPGLVTTPAGTLISVYDIRWESSTDLGSNIDIGMSRSTDGGRSWEPMKVIMDMGEYGGLPQAQNGVGDPSILVDDNTGEIFVVATWTHGLATRAWSNVGKGMGIDETAQLMIVSSKDDGLTWSEPRNVTEQVKNPDWYFMLQGPGRGITMLDGTLVFPMQFIGPDRVPNSTFMYSRDHGVSWTMAKAHPRSNTTESQICEVTPGVLMLNMRDNRGTGRAVYTTDDMGDSWKQHLSSGYLIEPVCMASILKVPAAENYTGKDLLLFSNPFSSRQRSHISIRASGDGGYTWNRGVTLDTELGWGYSCLSMIDPETVGIVYESSVSQLAFQAVKLKDILQNMNEIHTSPLGEMTYAGYSKGVSAPFFGCIGNSVVLAGGANFPDKPLLDGGAKKVYREIFVKAARSNEWKVAGQLPDSTAYGATYTVGKSLIFAGGNVNGKTTDKVYRVKLHCGRASVQELPSLPEPVEQAGWAQDGGKLYLVGGLNGDKPTRAVYVCEADKMVWTKLAELEEALVQPVAFASEGRLYVWCGFSPETKWSEDKGWMLSDGKWSAAPSIPDRATFTGATGVPLQDGRLLVLGGVNRGIFERALRNKPEDRIPYLSQDPAAYRFNRKVYIFDPSASVWSELGETGFTALAGAGAAACGNEVYVAGGEIKPGIRSSNIFKFSVK